MNVVYRSSDVRDDTVRREVCPYPGPVSFNQRDAAWFFGREGETASLVRRLETRMHTGGPAAVVGPPGSGKSSLLRAGLLPALAAGALPGSRAWPSLLFSPTAHPMVALVDGLAELTGIPAASLVGALTPDPHVGAALVRDAVCALAGGADPRLIIVVDRLEELFYLVPDEEQQRAFLDTLSVLAGPGRNGESPVALVVFELSAVCAERWFEVPQLLTALRDAIFLGSLSNGGLRSAIQRPAEIAGLTLEPGLVDLLLHDLAEVSPLERLSLLQPALWNLWQSRRDTRLTISAYLEAGGIAGIGATFAERIYQQLSTDERQAAMGVFLQLIRLGNHNQPIRQRVARAALYREDSPDAGVAMDMLLRGRVLTQEGELVEIANIGLLSGWPRLRQLLDNRQEIEDTTAAWEGHDRDPDWLYRGNRIAEAMAWVPVLRNQLSSHALEFLEASIEAHRRPSWVRRGVGVVIGALLTIALVFLMGALPTARGWWSMGSFFALWALLGAAALRTARRNDMRREPNPAAPRSRPGRGAAGSRTGAFVSGLLDVWLFPIAFIGPDRLAPLGRGGVPPSRERALRNVEESLDRVCGQLGRPPKLHEPAAEDPYNDVERGER
ncbi:AAA family ATPase [Streptomyces sp. NBC_00154]|uniref:nSTAND1 domain-containing NTPase n=1 Tax=Streptomyces sp. NBC_00154 TaxID=2975670 RepID=UPI002B1DCA25|nr:AAA family ATPase [Streptomyces sp. NBC_00154]